MAADRQIPSDLPRLEVLVCTFVDAVMVGDLAGARLAFAGAQAFPLRQVGVEAVTWAAQQVSALAAGGELNQDGTVTS